jgi:hypothetical protein
MPKKMSALGSVVDGTGWKAPVVVMTVGISRSAAQDADRGAAAMTPIAATAAARHMV